MAEITSSSAISSTVPTKDVSLWSIRMARPSKAFPRSAQVLSLDVVQRSVIPVRILPNGPWLGPARRNSAITGWLTFFSADEKEPSQQLRSSLPILPDLLDLNYLARLYSGLAP